MKNGIILAGGNGTRLYPLTHVVNKHLLGVDGKFILDYPIQTLKQMGVENLTVVLGGSHFSQVVDHLKDGHAFGMNVNYVYQGEAKGIAQAINLCKPYVCHGAYDDFAVILGDNWFEREVFWPFDPDRCDKMMGSVVLHKHSELQRFGVASILNKQIVHLEEKPKNLRPEFEQYAITGCYLFTSEYFEFFKTLKPSPRGEFEIVDIIQQYLDDDRLNWTITRGMWSDLGTHESIDYVNNYLHKKRNG
jgi:glucose-1-phosphate thymidylyltransferase